MINLKKNVENMNAEMAEIRSRYLESSKVAFAELARDFFRLYPDVLGFKWGQFEPWRDGEETEFIVAPNGIEILFEEQNGQRLWAQLYEDEYYGSEYSYYSEDGKYIDEDDGGRFPAHLNKAAREAAHLIHSVDEDILEAAFGNGAYVTVRPSGVEVEEYVDG